MLSLWKQGSDVSDERLPASSASSRTRWATALRLARSSQACWRESREWEPRYCVTSQIRQVAKEIRRKAAAQSSRRPRGVEATWAAPVPVIEAI